MAKRFVDTELDDKEWYCKLSCRLKCVVGFLHRKCNAAGVWDPNYTLAQAFIGEAFTEQEILSIDEGKQFVKLRNGKIFIPGFIKFQYGKLSKDCKPHLPIYKLLEKNGIDIDTIEMSDTVGKNHSISFRDRLYVLEQDAFTCCYCGKVKEERNLVIDHVVPRKMGGEDNIKNIVACCSPCNSKKSDFTLKEFCDLYKLDFETLNNRVLERLSRRVHDTLQEKDKDKDKEKDQHFGKSENLLDNSAIVPEMVKQFTELNTEYPVDQETDFPAIREIAVKILTWQKGNGPISEPKNSSEIKLRWGELVNFIRADDHYRGYSITRLNKHFQSIVQSYNSQKDGTHKQPAPGSNGKPGTSAARIKTARDW